MKILSGLKAVCESLGGSREQPPFSMDDPSQSSLSKLNAILCSWWFRAFWWGVLATIILVFCGQSSKFIYIDF